MWSFCLSVAHPLRVWLKDFSSNFGSIDPIIFERFGAITNNVFLKISNILFMKFVVKCSPFYIMV